MVKLYLEKKNLNFINIVVNLKILLLMEKGKIVYDNGEIEEGEFENGRFIK